MSETWPVTFPVKLPMNVEATSDSEPNVQRSFVSSHTNVLFVSVPLSTSIPASCDGLPVSSELSTRILSPILTVFELTVVVVPDTVRLPVIVALPATLIFVDVISSEVNVPSTCTSLNCTSDVVATAWPMLISPEDIVTPVPAEKCALTSAALGPVYVITPVPLLYANEPSPPASVTDIAPRARASV